MGRLISFLTFVGMSLLLMGANAGSTITAEALLEILQMKDVVFATGFTAKGAFIFAPSCPGQGPPRTMRWSFTTSAESAAYEDTVVEIKPFRFGPMQTSGAELTTLKTATVLDGSSQKQSEYFGPTPPIGSLPEWESGTRGPATCGHLSIGPPNVAALTFDVTRTWWSLGRGFATHIKRVNSITVKPKGIVSITASGTGLGDTPGYTWVIDFEPAADYVVRAASLFRGDSQEPEISIVTKGSLHYRNLSVPRSSEWRDHYCGGREYTTSTTSIRNWTDAVMFRRVQREMDSPYPVFMDVVDERMQPPTHKAYDPGVVTPRKW